MFAIPSHFIHSIVADATAAVSPNHRGLKPTAKLKRRLRGEESEPPVSYSGRLERGVELLSRAQFAFGFLCLPHSS
jgi:hypothetical protein